MEAFLIASAVVLILVGAFGLFCAARGLARTNNTVARVLFSVRDREPSRAHFALSSVAIIVLGIYLLLSNALASVPLWPLLILIVAFFVLQLTAHLRQGDV